MLIPYFTLYPNLRESINCWASSLSDFTLNSRRMSPEANTTAPTSARRPTTAGGCWLFGGGTNICKSHTTPAGKACPPRTIARCAEISTALVKNCVPSPGLTKTRQ